MIPVIFARALGLMGVNALKYRVTLLLALEVASSPKPNKKKLAIRIKTVDSVYSLKTIIK